MSAPPQPRSAPSRPEPLESFIPVCEPLLDGREREYVLDCLDGNWVSSLGEYIPRFEEAFARECDAEHAVACSSGTAAVHLALESVGVQPGDEVIIPAFTLIVSANMVALTGATPVLADVDPDTWCIDPAEIERKITPRTKAIMVVHMYGHPADMDAIMSIARPRDIRVIEDCAQGLGAEIDGRRVGAIGDVGAFSFYGNKLITTGEGGMVVTNDTSVSERAALLRDQAFEADRFIHREVGFNYRMTNIQAAIGLAQCERLDEKIDRKLEIAETYHRLFRTCSDVQLPVSRSRSRNVYWMFGIVLKPSFGSTPTELRRRLRDRGIDSRGFFIPMNRQPVYQQEGTRRPDLRGAFPVSEHLADCGLYLPSGLSITPEIQQHVVDNVLDCRN